MSVVRGGGLTGTSTYVGPGSHVFSFKITIEAMKSDIDEVALQGIEFWSNVCDEEMDLAIEASEVSLGDEIVGLGGRAVTLAGLWGISPLWI